MGIEKEYAKIITYYYFFNQPTLPDNCFSYIEDVLAIDQKIKEVWFSKKRKENIMSNRRGQRNFVQVYSGNLWQAQIIQGLLEANNIVCILKNNSASAVTSPYTDTAGEVLVMVDNRDTKFANIIIGECSLSSNPYN